MHSENKAHYGLLFVAVTIGWTWGVLAVPAVLRLDFYNPIARVAFVLAGASPSVIGLIFARLTGNGTYIGAVIKRTMSFGCVHIVDALITFGLVPTVTVISAYAGLVFFREAPDWSPFISRCENPIGFVLFALFTLVFGPLAEELGWRGYLFDCWEPKGIFVYGVGIGLIWTVWHLPMFFIVGSYQNGLLRQGALSVIGFVLSTTALSVIIGRLVKKTGSILAAVIFHFTINFWGELIPLAPAAELINTMTLIAIACALIIHERQREGCNGEAG